MRFHFLVIDKGIASADPSSAEEEWSNLEKSIGLAETTSVKLTLEEEEATVAATGRHLTDRCGVERSGETVHGLQRLLGSGVTQPNFNRLNIYRVVISVLNQLASKTKLIT